MEKKVKLSNKDNILLPGTDTEMIKDYKEDFPLDTTIIGILDTLKWMSNDLKQLERARADSGSNGIGLFKEIKFTSPQHGRMILSNNIFVLFGQTAAAHNENGVIVVSYASYAKVQVTPGTEPLCLCNMWYNRTDIGNGVTVSAVTRDSQLNVCDLTKEAWFCKKDASGNLVNYGAINYLIIGHAESFT